MKINIEYHDNYELTFSNGHEEKYKVKIDGSGILCAIQEYLKRSHGFAGKVLVREAHPR